MVITLCGMKYTCIFSHHFCKFNILFTILTGLFCCRNDLKDCLSYKLQTEMDVRSKKNCLDLKIISDLMKGNLCAVNMIQDNQICRPQLIIETLWYPPPTQWVGVEGRGEGGIGKNGIRILKFLNGLSGLFPTSMGHDNVICYIAGLHLNWKFELTYNQFYEQGSRQKMTQTSLISL